MAESIKFIGNPIYSLQTILRELSNANSSILPVIPDGTYGPNTYASVQSFQQEYGLQPTGNTDHNTWKSIMAAYSETKSSVTARHISDWQYLPERKQCILIQTLLWDLSEVFEAIPKPCITGTENPETAYGLRIVQQAASLPQTGTPDPRTLDALINLFFSI